jgi:hypothetical protein
MLWGNICVLVFVPVEIRNEIVTWKPNFYNKNSIFSFDDLVYLVNSYELELF